MDVSSKNSGDLQNLRSLPSYEAGIIQARAYRTIKKLTDALLAPYGLTSMQWFIIGLVHQHEPNGISLSKLSRLLGTNLPYVTNATNLLEKRSIIRKTAADDGRTKALRIEPAYARHIAVIERELRQGLQDSLYSVVTPAELLTYITVLISFTTLSETEQQ